MSSHTTLVRLPSILATRRQALALVAVAMAPAWAGDRRLEVMVAFDAVYIPALAFSSAAVQDAGKADAARAAQQRLVRQWPEHRSQLAAVLGPTAPKLLGTVAKDVERATAFVAQSNWKMAHEALEPIRERLMAARGAIGMDYFVDRLTAFHEPMEAMVLAAAEQATTADLQRRLRDRIAAEFAHARALWHGIEQHLPDSAAYGLTGSRLAQFRSGMADESRALGILSTALNGSDTAALIKAASAIKPPFARVFTAFGSPL